MSSLWEEIRYTVLQSGSRVKLLIGINVAVFFVFGFLKIIETLTTGQSTWIDLITNYLAVPADLHKLLYHFWTPLTYMFLHQGIFHILFNMLWLYWMGRIFEEYLGGKKLTTVYILGGLAGALLYVLAYNIFPLFEPVKAISYTVGAPAGVIAIVVATATLLPNYTIGLLFLGPVKLKWIALFYVLISFLGVTGSNAGGEIAHLGGALLGFVYIKQIRRGNDWGKSLEKLFKRPSKLKVVHGGKQNTGALPSQEEIDRILDKISKSGYDSLSKQEKNTLFKVSDDQEKG